MIKIGTIGTSKICENFIKYAIKNPNLKITACYSRDKIRAKEFIKRNNILARGVDSLEVLLDEIDAIYISSPNGMHYEQAKFFIMQNKHVFVEKPITLDYEQAQNLYDLAKFHGVILMEAYKTSHLPQFKFLNDFVEKYEPFIASINMSQYSSRMPEIKRGVYNSVFDEHLGKGSTYDMLIYPVELAVALFGPVNDVKSMGHTLPNGSSLTDLVIVKHTNDVIVSICCSKGTQGFSSSEIMADSGTLTFENCTSLTKINVYDLVKGSKSNLFEKSTDEEDDSFKYEISVFVSMIKNNDLVLRDYLLDISCESIRVLNLVEKNKYELGEN